MATPTIEAGGLLLVDKPAGMSSHDVVGIARRSLRTRRVGHAGTLDPFATGLLVMLFGRGTRLISYLPGEPKVYEAVIQFGVETDTDDLTGVVTRTAEPPQDDAINAALRQLTGTIQQTPPAYSAKQVAGTRAYAAARRGKPLELAPVSVAVDSWTILARESERLEVRISCGGGTYIRALARDLGRLSGSAAHVAKLRRTNSGPFSVEDAVSFSDLERGEFTPRPLLDAVRDLPVRSLDSDELRRVTHGNSIPLTGATHRAALVDNEGTLIAVAEAVGDELRPKVVFVDA